MRYLVVLMAVVLVVGCGKQVAERAIEKSIKQDSGQNADVDIGNNTMTIKTDEGTFAVASGKDAKLPATFPDDILIYKGASLQTVMETPEGFHLVCQIADALSKVLESYQTSMISKGWAQDVSMDMGAQKMVVFKKDERTANIILTSEGNTTQLTLTVANGK